LWDTEIVDSFYFYQDAALKEDLAEQDLDSRDISISFKMPLSLDYLTKLDSKDIKLKKTELKRQEKEQKRIEKQQHKHGSTVAIWEDGETGDPWWQYGKKICLNEIISEYKYPLQKMLSED